MKNRNPIAVVLLTLITFGFYGWYWQVKTKGEMNKLGEHIPTAFLWLIPIIGPIWWLWKYCEGVGHVTNEQTSAPIAFILIFLLGMIGGAIVQNSFNQVGAAPTAASPTPMPPTPPAAVPPTAVPPAPVA